MSYEATVSNHDLAVIDAAVPINLHRWGIAETAAVKLLNHSENTTYEIREGSLSFILRVHRLGYHTAEAIAAELDWVQAISKETKIRTATPIQGINKNFIQAFETSQKNNRLAVLFEFLEGEEPSEDNNLPASFEQLGEITATLHKHSMDRVKDKHLPTRPRWDFEHSLGSNPIWGPWQKGIGMTPEIHLIIQKGAKEISKKLEQYGTGAERFGLIHADLRLANLLIHKGEVRVIDFDDCGYGWFMYDLGSALSFIEHKEYVPALIKAWIKGYNQIRELTYEEVAMIPSFILLRRILLVAWLGSHSETEIAREIGQSFTSQTRDLVTQYLDGALYV
ncbi:MAG: phosphotransferase enzyme family protein [Thiotrichales bacterium]